jgi:hypothetical protein
MSDLTLSRHPPCIPLESLRGWAGMDKDLKDPKNPNAWWAVPFPSFRAMFPFPKNLSRSQKARLYLIFVAMGIMCAVEVFYLNKFMK